MSNEENNQNQAEEVVLTEAEQQQQHDQAMIDKVDANAAKTEGELQTDQERMLAGKYKTVEELEKAYEHLQSKMGQPDETPEEETEEVSEDTSREDAQELAGEAGIDYTALEGEYQELGGLSTETYEALAEAGIPEAMVDAYIAGQEALTQTTVQNMYDVAGGESEYVAMIEWARDTLPESDIEAFNNSLINEDTSRFAIQGLTARYNAEKGPNLVRGSQSVGRTGGYASKAEMMNDMSNSQYQQDPAYRAEVQRRVALSDF
jgi:hypothetical protein